MTGRFVRRVLLASAMLALPVVGYAQEAVLTGTVSDSTGGVLPGVTVTAVLEATGNRFETVTDESGNYRIPVRVGVYTVSAELQGFSTQARTGLQLLVGQTAAVNLQMSPSTVQETVTVTAEAPLLNVSTSSMGGNVDPRQVQELPVNGRNWMALALLAPGSRTSSTNATSPLPDRNGGEVREYQTNLDGMQVTNSLGGGGQPAFSQEMIAEFQFISNRFDATQGRSQAVQVNVVTKSGTNRLAGSFRANFRDDQFNADDPALNRKVPISNQQYAGSAGGPVIRDRLHYFGFYEYEREPRTSIWNTPYPRFNIELQGKVTKRLWGARLDYQLSPQTRLMLKGNLTRTFEPFGAGSNNNHPASTASTGETQNTVQAQLTQVLSNRALNEVRVAWAGYVFRNANLTHWTNHWAATNGPYGPTTIGSPRIQFTGFNITGNNGYPRHRSQDLYSVQDAFTVSYNAMGRHDLKAGAEFLLHHEMSANCTNCMGNIDARGGAISTLRPGIEDIFPDAFNVDTWNLAAISPLVRTYRLGVHKGRRADVDLPYYAGYVQDDWKVSNKLTLNLGVRYDLTVNSFAQYGEFSPFMEKGRPQDADNIQPRLGFAYQLNDRTVLRGGGGKYYAEVITPVVLYALEPATIAVLEVANDGRPDFAVNPFNGPAPTFEQALTRFCSAPEQAANFAAWRARNFAGAAPCVLRGAGEMAPPPEYAHVPHTWQASAGIQRQVGSSMAVEADYVYSRGRDEKFIQDNVNLSFTNASGIGVNNPYSNRALLPYPQFGIVAMTPFTGRSAYHALQTGFTKRMSHNWQAGATYSLAGLWSAEGQPLMGVPGSVPQEVPFSVSEDLGGPGGWTYALSDQRHRAVFNGIWQVGRGFQVSGLHYFGAGNRASSNYGGDSRGLGAGGEARLRPNGTIVPKNTFIQPQQNRTDIRVQQRIPLRNRLSIDVIAEMFNMFNRPNWTLSTQESAADYNKRVAGQYRSAQFGFRMTF
ncbi:MAG: TonB-dependent receptor [Acidobacteria bacterium]|nr:TonB-dependent receptor [Acidobacteriota bacterium]